MKNILVVGLGSMGKRRIRLVKRVLGDQVKIYGVDLNEERRKTVAKEYGIEVTEDLGELLKSQAIDASFVSTAPLAHAKIISKILEYGIPVFSELNLVTTDYQKNIELAKKMKTVLFMSSTMLYRKEMQYIIGKVKESNKPLDYMYHVGQYLLDWHPWDNLKDFFISKKETNGVREILVVEIPWLIEAFGSVKSMKVVRDKITDLPVDYEDNYYMIFEHEHGHKGVFVCDVVSREAVRDFTVFGEEIYLHWGGTADALYQKNITSGEMEFVDLYSEEKVNHREGYSNTQIENAYEEEIRNYFSVIEGKAKPLYSFEKDIETIRLIDEIEER